jgi:hypothetical protein
LNVVFIIIVLILSIPIQKFFLNYGIPIACSEVGTTIYPKLNFSTYLGGEDSGEGGYGIAIEEDKHFYVTGYTSSNDFPTQYAYKDTFSGERDATITKFNNNSLLLWSTYFGGNDIDVSNDIAVSQNGSCYITGFTRSSDFPLLNAFNYTYSGSDDAFLAKFSSEGILLWSTFLGGNDWDYGNSIAIAVDGSCYITGEIKSTNFPIHDAYDNTFNGGNFDAFVARFSTNGALLWSTFLGGNENDGGFGIAVTNDGSCYVTGRTKSTNFPTQDAYDESANGHWDIFISKFHANGSLLWSTLFGGTLWDDVWSIATASDDSCYITGYTTSPDFPTKDAYNNTYGTVGDAFVAKFSSNGSLVWSTFLGGNDIDRGNGITATNDGSCYVTGETGSNNFPNTYTYNASLESNYDVFVTKFSPEGSLLWSTCIGGDNTDTGYSIVGTESGSCYVIGKSYSLNFPTLNAYDSTLGATSDIFIAKFVDTPIPSSSYRAYYGFLAFIIIIPVIVIIFIKKRK